MTRKIIACIIKKTKARRYHERILYRANIKHSKIIYLSKIDLVRTYRGATLGWFWAIFKPAFAIIVYYFTFRIGLKVSKNIFGYPYYLWLTIGIVPWFFIRDILQQGIESIRKYHYLVTKVKFPVSIIPTFTTLSNFMIHLILLILVFSRKNY